MGGERNFHRFSHCSFPSSRIQENGPPVGSPFIYSASSSQTSRIASRIFSFDACGSSSKSSRSQIH
ncbi:hypothetical protein CKO_00259 [Citrobacter koseri ATCC BAA-895]|uniref:Uncharacterized protein n=1 Tax=Citrobacter koseri (strain ATCC BAA-895 / CDC 4225-83 / SGSC4696) TaxID=290338 RepID=A8AD59_CITK8|nr:hypothetical protein CKO_00259 [Citrobacter koseri ATCC BAA-895]